MNEQLAQMIRDLNLGFEHIPKDSIIGMSETIVVLYPNGKAVCEFSKVTDGGKPTRWAVESYNRLDLGEIEFIQKCLVVLGEQNP